MTEWVKLQLRNQRHAIQYHLDRKAFIEGERKNQSSHPKKARRHSIQTQIRTQQYQNVSGRPKNSDDQLKQNEVHGPWTIDIIQKSDELIRTITNEQDKLVISGYVRTNAIDKYELDVPSSIISKTVDVIQKSEDIWIGEVREWLEDELKLPQYLDLFMKHGVDRLSIVKLLDKNALKEMGVDKIGHQLLILSEIDKLKIQ